MRDPKRIRTILNELETYWNTVPDWRLSQLIVNVTGWNDPFYYEDENMLSRLKELNSSKTSINDL